MYQIWETVKLSFHLETASDIKSTFVGAKSYCFEEINQYFQLIKAFSYSVKSWEKVEMKMTF